MNLSFSVLLCKSTLVDAVGLTAAFATRLADCELSANVFAGFYHDHIFVQNNTRGSNSGVNRLLKIHSYSLLSHLRQWMTVNKSLQFIPHLRVR